MADPLEQAAAKLEAAAKSLADWPALARASAAQQQAAQAGQALATPAGQGALAKRTELETAQSTAELRQNTLRMRAEAAYLQTPQGQAQLVAQQTAQKEATQAEKALAALKEPQQGPAGAASTAIAAATSALGVLKIAAVAAAAGLGMITELGSKASPQAAATLAGSFDLLAVKLGAAVLPIMEELSRGLQQLSRAVPSPEVMGTLGSAWVTMQKRISFPGVGAAWDALTAAVGSQTAQSWQGLPQARVSTHEEAYERLQAAGLNLDPLQTEIMQEQLANLKDILGVLKERPVAPAGLNVSFR